jgi:hypothetical protein
MLKNKIVYFIIGIFVFCFAAPIYSQQELDEDRFEMLKDEYAGKIIELMVKLDTLNSEIARLQQISRANDSIIENYENDIYALVGTDKNGVNDFRRKFEETEKRITSKTGTPSDARRSWFDEIANGKIRCLPEFQERYISMKRQLEDWEGMITKAPVTTEGTYTVVKGDCLWRISEMKYNSPYYWPAIWEANKNGVVNQDELPDPRHKAVMNPNYIYPGQVLKIPSLNPEIKKGDFKERIKKFRRVLKDTPPP